MLFFHEDLSSDRIHLSKEESQHAIRVLRLQKGDKIDLTDGKGTIVRAEIVVPDSKKCEVRIVEKKSFNAPKHHIHIAVAPTKNLDRTTWFIEKAIEIGVQEISFVLCKNSERRVLKMDKVLAKSIAAAKQSLSPFIPKINDLIGLDDFISSKIKAKGKFVAHLGEAENTQELFNSITRDDSYCVLIGPEGDFREEEIELAKSNGFQLVKMGNSRLRTETAALFACAILNVKNQY